MGASGRVDLREAALLGFGAYSQVNLTGLAVPGIATLAYTFDLPADTGTQSGRRFALLGYFWFGGNNNIAYPKEWVQYALVDGSQANANIPNSLFQQMNEDREPILRVLVPERRQITLAFKISTFADYNSNVNVAAFYDRLDGNIDQLVALYKWLHDDRAPGSLLESFFGALQAPDLPDPANPSGGYY